MTKVTKRRGRPPSLNKKHTRTLTLSDDAWNGLRNQAERQGISISELNEKLGKSEFAVIDKKEERLREVVIYSRICDYTERPSPGFFSLLAFVKNVIFRLSSGNSSVEEVESQVIGVVNSVIDSLILTSYLYPGIIAFRSLTSCMPWLTYTLLLDYGFAYDSTAPINRKEITIDADSYIDKIAATLNQLKTSGVPIYSILRMRFLEGLSISQMHRIIKLQEWQSSNSDVKDRVKQAFGQFRELCSQADVQQTKIKNIGTDTGNNSCGEEESKVPEEAIEYCKLMSLNYWNLKERKELKDILGTVNDNSKVAFWLCELNYFLGEEDYTGQFEKLRRSVIKDMDLRLLSLLKEIDKKLVFCTGRQQIENLLLEAIKQQVGQVKQSEFKDASFNFELSQGFTIFDIFKVSVNYPTPS